MLALAVLALSPAHVASLGLMAARAGDGGAGGSNVDWTTITGNVLTLLTLLAAVAALRYARDSARAAAATLKPMHDVEARLTATAETLKTTLELAERGRREERLVHRLAQYGRVFAAVDEMQRALGQQDDRERAASLRQGQRILRAAVAALPPADLPRCRQAGEASVHDGSPPGGVDAASIEVSEAIRTVRQELDDLLESSEPVAGSP